MKNLRINIGKALFIAGAAYLFSANNVNEISTNQQQTDSKVWICTGENSTRYHSKSDCAGLNNCQASKKLITLTQARKMKRTPCKRCFPSGDNRQK